MCIVKKLKTHDFGIYIYTKVSLLDAAGFLGLPMPNARRGE